MKNAEIKTSRALRLVRCMRMAVPKKSLLLSLDSHFLCKKIKLINGIDYWIFLTSQISYLLMLSSMTEIFKFKQKCK